MVVSREHQKSSDIWGKKSSPTDHTGQAKFWCLAALTGSIVFEGLVLLHLHVSSVRLTCGGFSAHRHGLGNFSKCTSPGLLIDRGCIDH